ncbi:hypothetical protein PS910_03909 [Pseudomonas fluorescens]|nr:hypothetical protein PS910_03909 [Pseudomonas fluorescens]
MPVIAIYGGCVQEVFGPAGFLSLPRSCSLHVATTHSMQGMGGDLDQANESFAMLKIVPDPPQSPHNIPASLEDILVQTSEYLVCALTTANQSVLQHTTPNGQVLTLATMHEIEAARLLVEAALSQVQVRH